MQVLQPISTPRHSLQADLRRWLADRQREAFVGTDVAVISRAYELRADVAVALDASARARTRWIEAVEGRSLDVVFLFIEGERLATLTAAARHVERGASEAFVFDARANQAWGFRRVERRVDAIPLTSTGGLRSRVLGADIVARCGRPRLAPVATNELYDVLDRIDHALARIERQRASAAS
jgi:hypothetical protein